MRRGRVAGGRPGEGGLVLVEGLMGRGLVSGGGDGGPWGKRGVVECCDGKLLQCFGTNGCDRAMQVSPGGLGRRFPRCCAVHDGSLMVGVPAGRRRMPFGQVGLHGITLQRAQERNMA